MPFCKMNKWLMLLIAVILIALPIALTIILDLWAAIKIFLIGAVVIAVFLIGIFMLILSISEF